MNETEYWLTLEDRHNELIDYAREIEDKLEKIEEIAKENNICEGFGCIPMYKILKIIKGAEDEV